MPRPFLILILLCMFQGLFAQHQVLMRDTSAITARLIPASRMEQYRNDPAFQYETVHEPVQNWWTRFWRWFWQRIGDIFSSSVSSKTTRFFFIAIAVVILGLAIYIFSGMRNGGFFSKKNSEEPMDYTVFDDDIHGINFEEAIENAVLEKNFRLAVRLLYLQTLKNLTDNNLINWQLNKTNADYVNELAKTVYRQQFFSLTRQFENNWYGDLPIASNEFQEVRERFNIFNKQLL